MLFSIDIYKYIKRDTVVNSYFYFTDDRITVVKIIFFFQLTKESPHYTNQHKILEGRPCTHCLLRMDRTLEISWKIPNPFLLLGFFDLLLV